MANLLVINHGTCADKNKPNYILATLSNDNTGNSPYRIDIPGYASADFNLRAGNTMKAKWFSKIRAGGYVEKVTARWFEEDLMAHHDTVGSASDNPWELFTKVIFIGWSRGCINTWYELFYMSQFGNFLNSGFNGRKPEIHIFHIDPCFGPSNWKSDIRTGMNLLSGNDTVTECYAVNESGVKVLPGVYASYPFNQSHPCTRHFLPGKHATGALSDDHKYGTETNKLWVYYLKQMLARNCPTVDQAGIIGAKNLNLYTQFKQAYLNLGEYKYRFNRAQRKDLWTLNTAQKKTAGIYDTWFFMNQDEYALYGGVPALRNLLRAHRAKPPVDTVRLQYNSLDIETKKMIKEWVRRIPKLTKYYRYLSDYRAIFT